MQRRDVINQRQLQLLNYVYATHTNELALVTNVLGHVSMFVEQGANFPQYFSYKIPRCFYYFLLFTI